MSRPGDHTELQNLVEMPAKKGNCCSKYPVACGCTLLTVMAFSAAVAIGLGVAYHPIQKALNNYYDHRSKILPCMQQVVQVPLTEVGPAVRVPFPNITAPTYDSVYFYFFNLVNPDNVSIGGKDKPILKEMGPFVYKKARVKTNLVWSEGGDVLSYNLTEAYTLDRELSVADPTQAKVTTVNFPLLGVLLTLERMEQNPNLNFLEKELLKLLIEAVDEIKMMFSWETLFSTHTVDELLWGYEDPLLKLLSKLVPSMIPSGRFGLYNRINVEVPNMVYTGKNNLSLVGQFIQWNGNFNISQWGTPTAKMINGTGGYIFHPGMTREEAIEIFFSELFRSGYFVYDKDVSVHGIQLFQFILPKEELVSKNEDPGFYPAPFDGLLNLTAVYPQNVPVYVSKPHFLDADPQLLKNVTGLHPNRSIHDSYIGIEPITGAVLSAAKRLQVNMRLQNKSSIPEMENLPDNLFLPLFYASEEGQISSSLAAEFKREIYNNTECGRPAAVQILGGAVLCIVGIAGLTFFVCLLCLIVLVVQQWMKRGRDGGLIINRPLEHAPLMDGGDESDDY